MLDSWKSVPIKRGNNSLLEILAHPEGYCSNVTSTEEHLGCTAHIAIQTQVGSPKVSFYRG